jgi:hypothetical protein
VVRKAARGFTTGYLIHACEKECFELIYMVKIERGAIESIDLIRRASFPNEIKSDLESTRRTTKQRVYRTLNGPAF